MRAPVTLRWLAFAMVSCVVSGCSTLRAAAQERRRTEALRDRANLHCEDSPQMLMVRPESIKLVEPLRVFRSEHGPPVEVLLGSRLHLTDGAYIEPRALERALRCYEADAASRSNGFVIEMDPFWLADGRVRISVLQTDSDRTIELRAEPEFEAPRVLENAQAFARGATSGGGSVDPRPAAIVEDGRRSGRRMQASARASRP